MNLIAAQAELKILNCIFHFGVRRYAKRCGVRKSFEEKIRNYELFCPEAVGDAGGKINFFLGEILMTQV